MKKNQIILALALLVFSCKNDLETSPSPKTTHSAAKTDGNGCLLTAIDRGNGFTHQYIYGTNGLITSMIRDFGGPILKYDFTYNSSGELIKSDIYFNGNPAGAETYEWSGGRLVKVNFDGGVNNISYDNKGRMTRFTIETGNPDFDAAGYLKYNTNGIINVKGFSNLDGTIKYFEARTNPVGLVHSPESILVAHGLPFDVLGGVPYTSVMGNTGTAIQYFIFDENGNEIPAGADDIKTLIQRNKKYAKVYQDSSDGTTQQYTFSGCAGNN